MLTEPELNPPIFERMCQVASTPFGPVEHNRGKGIPWVSPNEEANVNALRPSRATRLIGSGSLAYCPATSECCRHTSQSGDLKKTTTMKYGENLLSGLLGGPLFPFTLLCHEHFLQDSTLPNHYLSLRSDY